MGSESVTFPSVGAQIPERTFPIVLQSSPRNVRRELLADFMRDSSVFSLPSGSLVTTAVTESNPVESERRAGGQREVGPRGSDRAIEN